MEETKCLHAPCKCMVQPEEEYCSMECQHSDLAASALGHNGNNCVCHHPDCEGVPQTITSLAEGLAVPDDALATG